MTLTIPYEYSGVQLDTKHDGALEIGFTSAPDLKNNLFNQLLNTMDYDDIINAITPQSFEQIVEHYNTEYEKENL